MYRHTFTLAGRTLVDATSKKILALYTPQRVPLQEKHVTKLVDIIRAAIPNGWYDVRLIDLKASTTNLLVRHTASMNTMPRTPCHKTGGAASCGICAVATEGGY